MPYVVFNWGGLEPSDDALMDGSVGSDWWHYAVGAYRLYSGGIPSYGETDTSPALPQQKVELYVKKKTNIAGAGDFFCLFCSYIFCSFFTK